MTGERFPVLDRASMTPRQREVADEIAAGPRGALKGPFQVLIHHPELASRVQALGEHLRFGTAIARELLEIMILTVARRWSCQYEWSAHARLARDVGVAADIIDAIAADHTPARMSSDERIVHDLAHETAWEGAPRAPTLDAALARFGRPGVLDLLAVCGYYSMLAMVLNAAQPPLPAGSSVLAPLGYLRENSRNAAKSTLSLKQRVWRKP